MNKQKKMFHDDYCPLPVVFCIIIHFHTRINQLTSINYIISCMLMTSTHIMLFNRLNMMFHRLTEGKYKSKTLM